LCTSNDVAPHPIRHAVLGRVSCLLLGEEPLLIHCAEVLRERGHRIAGIVTAAPQLARWAEENGVRVIGRADYPEVLSQEPVEVLLSITHPALIAPEDIAKVRLAALNYHDGPLPRYAGMNGSTWALLNGESSHAIVWHHLTAGLDEGDIVERREVKLDPRETSVSLNMGNSARALESFRALVRRIETRELAGTPQGGEIERLIYSRHDRPSGLCVIDWTNSAPEIDRLVRACEFGPYTNRFGSAKARRGERAVVVKEASVVAGVGAAGSVLELGEGGIVVACRDGALQLRRFTSLTGEPLSALEAAEALELVPGRTLTPAGPPITAAFSRQVAEAEAFFVAALSRRAPPSLPFETPTAEEACSVELELPESFLRQFDGRRTDAISALYAFTLSCLIRDDAFDLAYVDGGRRGELSAAEGLLFPSLPLHVAVDATRGFSSLVTQFSERREQLSKRPAFLRDLVARHPALRDQPDLRRGEISPVALLLDGGELPPGARVCLTLDSSGAALLSDGHIDRRRLDAIAGQMVSVATTVAAAPDRPLTRIDVLDDAQRQRQIFDWNATARPFPDTLRIHDLFEAQADRRPDAVALVFEGQTTTFGEVELGANRVANALQARGVRPGDFCGLVAERGVDLVIAMLGIVKAGCAYVPVDPSYPEERVRFVLEDARCAAVLASPGLDALCGPARPIVIIDGPEVRSAPSDRPSCPATAGDVCYAIYTSGSTGRPKGVVLTHRAVVNTLVWVSRTFRIGPADRLLFVTSPSFDLSVYDVFGALGAGASIEIGSAALLREPADLAHRLCEGLVTIWDSAPAALSRLAPFFPACAPASRLRLVMLSGDWIPVSLPGVLKRVFPGVEVNVLGGATEAAIWSNFFQVENVDPQWSSIPYGVPIQNARYYILDGHLRPLPVGIAGDLYIAGVCLAEGYLNRPTLTHERFVADPFVSGQRMYKTGDLARYWDDGTMEFLGRSDFQVKIRGFRVELGEVEAAMRALPGVREALCATSLDAAAQKSLVAYVVPQRQAALDVQALREELASRLPDFMVPTHVIPLRALPLSPSGKIDRQALPSPAETAGTAEFREPRGPVEIALAGLWQELLQRKVIGARDDFFELGGHSLLAVMLIAEMRTRFGVEIPLSQIIASSTIESLAAIVERSVGSRATSAGGPGEASMLVELKRGGPKCLFLVHDGQGETLLYRNLAQRLPSHFAVYGILPRRLPGVPLADTRISAMAASYLVEVRRRQPHGPYHLGGMCAGGVISFAMASQLEREGEEVELVVLLEAVEPTTRPRSWTTANRRWHRLKGLFRRSPRSGDEKQAEAGLDVWEAARGAIRKAGAATRYEIAELLTTVSVKLRARLLPALLSRGSTWPSWIPPLTARQIYLAARPLHTTRVTHANHVLLVKASEGSDADAPMSESFEDPLFGWKRFAGVALESVTTRGGHVSMLQEPQVEVLAAHLERFLTPSTPLTGPGHVGSSAATRRVKRPSVLVITVSYKSARLVEDSLRALARERAAAPDIDLRAFVVDNASGDGPALKCAIERNAWGGWATLVTSDHNGGFSYGNNLGFRHAFAEGPTPDYFLLLNPDAAVLPGAIAELVRFLEQHSDVGIAGSRLQFQDGTPWPYAFRFPSVWSEIDEGLGLGLVTSLLRSRVVARRMGDLPERVDWVPGASMMVRRRVVEDLGGLDEKYFLYFEELDFCLQANRAGWQTWYVPQSRVMHIAGQSTGVTARGRTGPLPEYWFRSRSRFFAKNHGLPYAAATDVAALAAHGVGRIKRRMQNRPNVPAFMVDLLRSSVIRQRNRIVENRSPSVKDLFNRR
jgi:amino acid adenylation domain-containing protein